MNGHASYIIILLVAAVAALFTAAHRWRRRHERPLAATGAVLLVACAEWMLAAALEMAFTDPASKLLWYKMSWLGQEVIPATWLVLAWQFSGRDHYVTRRNLVLLSLFPMMYLVLVFTNDSHGLVWTNRWFETSGSLRDRQPHFGVVAWVSYAYAYAIIVTGTFLLMQMLIRSRRLHLWQAVVLLISVSLAMSVNVLEWAGVHPVPGLQLTPLLLGFTVPLAAAALARLERLEIIPVARGAVVETMSDAVIVLDAHGRVVDMNPAGAQILGGPPSQVLGRPLTQAWPEWSRWVASPAAGDGASCELEVSQGAVQQTYDVRVSPLSDWRGRMVSQVIVLRDVTERSRADKALRESEEKYRLHFENLNDVIWTMDSQFQVISVSPSVERHLGYTPEDVIGKTFPELNILGPEYLEAALSDTLRVLAGEWIASAVYEFITKDGRRIIGEVSGAPVVRDGKVTAIISVARDITERQQAEEQLKVSLQEKEVLLKEIHHRVKNNLQVISSLLSLQASSIASSAIEELFHESQNRIQSMALVHEALYQSGDLSRIDMGAYVRDMTGHLQDSYAANARGVGLQVDSDHVYQDIDKAIPCGLIINELVSNAFKHAFPNGRNGTIRVELRADGDGGAVVLVQDDGVGLPPNLDFRNTTSLGLLLVNSLARQLNGTIELRSENGTRVTLTLPAVTAFRP